MVKVRVGVPQLLMKPKLLFWNVRGSSVIIFTCQKKKAVILERERVE